MIIEERGYCGSGNSFFRNTINIINFILTFKKTFANIIYYIIQDNIQESEEKHG